MTVRARRFGWLLVGFLVAAGCEDPSVRAESWVPEERLDSIGGCESQGLSCSWKGVRRRLDGRLIHRRIEGHPQIAVRILFDRSRRALSSDEYWAEQVALQLFDWAGRTGHSQAWNAHLAEIGAEIYTASTEEYVALVGLAPAAHWVPLWWQLSGDLGPGRGSVDPSLAQGVRSLESWVSGLGNEAPDAAEWEAWLGLEGTTLTDYSREALQSLAALDAAAIDRAWERMFDRDHVHVVVVGDLSVSRSEEAVAEWFERWSDASRGADEVAEPLPSAGQQVVLDYPDSDAWHVVGYFAGPPTDAADFAPLQLGMEVLARRLFEQVRDEQGLAYTVGARLYEGHVSNGVFWFSSDQPEAAIAVASKTVTDTIQGTTQKQVDTARAQILRRLLSEADTPEGIARLLGRYELLHGGRARDYAAALDEATASEVRAALRAFFRSLSLAAAGSGAPLQAGTLKTLDPRLANDSSLAALRVSAPEER